MKILNYDNVVQTKKCKINNSLNLPGNIRCIICGPAGCGKTNLLFNFLCNDGWIDYDKLYIYSKSLFQDKYVQLRRAFDEIDDVATFCSNNEDVITPENILGNRPIMVFDDVMIDKQNIIERYFAYGRHVNVNVFYLCQTYSRIPKQVVRDNANVIIVFRQDDRNLKHIYDNHVGADMTFNEFKTFCGQTWNDNEYGFVTIDKTKPMTKKRYREML